MKMKPCNNPDELFKTAVEYLKEEKPIKYTIKNHPDMIQECAACELDGNYVGYEETGNIYKSYVYIRTLYNLEEPTDDYEMLLSCLDKKEFLTSKEIIFRLGCGKYYEEHNSSALSNRITRILKQHKDEIDIKEGNGKLPCRFKLKE